MKPKVGEVWMVDSAYSWGWCLVRINIDKVDYFLGDVLAAKDMTYAISLCNKFGDSLGISFSLGVHKFIRRIPEAE
jgi:hypothetical protein